MFLRFLVLFSLCCAGLRGQTLRYAMVLRHGWYQMIDTAGRVLADSLRTANELHGCYNVQGEGLFPCIRNGKLGFKNTRNEVVVPPVYLSVGDAVSRSSCWQPEDEQHETLFREGRAVVASAGLKFGIIDQRGRLVADTVYDYIGKPEGGVYAARRGDTLYLLDRQGDNLLRFSWRTDPKLYPRPQVRDGLLCVMVRISGLPYPDPAKPADRGGSYQRASAADLHTYKVGFVDRTGRLVIDTALLLGLPLLGEQRQGCICQ